MKRMKNSEYLELLCMLIETVENFLDDRGIEIKNEEKNEDHDASNIYGSDYFFFEEAFGKILKDYELVDVLES